MSEKNIIIRLETKDDYTDDNNIVGCSFIFDKIDGDSALTFFGTIRLLGAE